MSFQGYKQSQNSKEAALGYSENGLSPQWIVLTGSVKFDVQHLYPDHPRKEDIASSAWYRESYLLKNLLSAKWCLNNNIISLLPLEVPIQIHSYLLLLCMGLHWLIFQIVIPWDSLEKIRHLHMYWCKRNPKQKGKKEKESFINTLILLLKEV